jgi:phosphatidate cytidylyltransferase
VEDHDQYERGGESPAEAVSERVRIIGAQPAATVAGHASAPEATPETPGVGFPQTFEDLHFDADEERLDADEEPLEDMNEPTARSSPVSATGRSEGDAGGDWNEESSSSPRSVAIPDMPHWADPPTGEVPTVLDRRSEEDARDGQWAAAGDTGPAWREHQHEWEGSGFDPSLLADEETRVGALEETPVEERRPWEFADLRAAEAAEERWEKSHAVGSATDTLWDQDDDRPEAAGVERVISPPEKVTRPSEGPTPQAASPKAPVSPPPVRVGARDRVPPLTPPSSRPAARPVPTDDGGTARNMPVAIATGIGFAIVAVLCFEGGSLPTLVLSTVVATLAAAECYAALRRSGRRPATLLGLVATVAVMVAAYAKGIAALPLVLVLVVTTSMVWYLVGAERGSPVEGVATTVFAFAWVGLLGSFAGLLLAPSLYPHRHGVAFLLGAIVATIGADVGALVVGSWLGRHPLAPTVSPHKTWEGVAGGAVLAVALSAALTGQVHPWTVPKAAVLGLVVAVVAPIGDLCESLVKRDLGLKDMGSLLPGHGGVLDRMDALLFVLPATYYLVRVLQLG